MSVGSGQVWLTVPTHTTPPSLFDLLDQGLPSVVVHTTTTTDPVPGAANVTDLGPVNISRWWNTGLDEITRRGGTVAVVANHDVVAGPGQLARLAAGLLESGATLARVAELDFPATREWPGRRQLTGWCFAMDLTHGLRPNELFRWWCGDDWLDLTARLGYQGVAGVPAGIHHRRPNGMLYPPQFEQLVAADRRAWDSTSRALLKKNSHRLGATS